MLDFQRLSRPRQCAVHWAEGMSKRTDKGSVWEKGSLTYLDLFAKLDQDGGYFTKEDFRGLQNYLYAL